MTDSNPLNIVVSLTSAITGVPSTLRMSVSGASVADGVLTIEQSRALTKEEVAGQSDITKGFYAARSGSRAAVLTTVTRRVVLPAGQWQRYDLEEAL